MEATTKKYFIFDLEGVNLEYMQRDWTLEELKKPKKVYGTYYSWTPSGHHEFVRVWSCKYNKMVAIKRHKYGHIIEK